MDTDYKNKKTVLTDVKFWEKDWGELNFPIHLDPEKRVERVLMKLFDDYLNLDNAEQKTCIEIGCNPGKFLIYCGETLNYDLFGIDYDKKGVSITERNLAESRLRGEILEQDFFSFDSHMKFDLVLSLGFIEHFQGDKLEEAIDRHVSLLKPRGKLFLSVPNFRYLNFLFAYIFRKKMLGVHNLEVMQKSFFLDIASKKDLDIEYIGYFGGLHPGGIKIGSNNFLSRFITDFLIFYFEKLSFLDNFNSKFFSHHLGAVFTKKS